MPSGQSTSANNGTSSDPIARLRKATQTVSLGDVTTFLIFNDEQEKKELCNCSDRLSDSHRSLHSSASTPSQSDEEDESSEDEDDERPVLEGMSLHRMHSNTPEGRGPVRINGCNSAQQFANRGLNDMKLRGITSGGDIQRSVIANRNLHFACGTSTLVVPLWYSEVATVSVGGPQDIYIIAIVPKGASLPELLKPKVAFPNRVENQDTEGKTEGYLFTCPGNTLAENVSLMSQSGIVRVGLTSTYQILTSSKRGVGSFGHVVSAVELKKDRTVAVKFMAQKTSAAVVMNEVDMMLRAQGHPNVIKYHSVWIEKKDEDLKHASWMMVMDYYSKGDLYDRVVDGKRLQEQDAMPITHDILSALSFLHQRSIFHRDVKPENMLMATNDRIVLTDFGIATLVSDEEQLKRTVGTVGYASPEMLTGKATSFEGDEFGAGVVLYFMLSKSTPFLAPTSSLTVERTKLGKVNLNYGCFDHISSFCKELILGFVCKEVEKRLKAPDVLKRPEMRKIRHGVSTEPDLNKISFGRSSPNFGEIDQSKANDVKFSSSTVGKLPKLKGAEARLEL